MRVIATAVAVLVLALPSWAAPPRSATVKLQSLAPLVVRGVDFGQGERVAVIASFPGTQQIVTVTARRNGRFSASFTLTVTRCTQLTVRAIGSLGSRAILQRDPGCEREKKRKPGR